QWIRHGYSRGAAWHTNNARRGRGGVPEDFAELRVKNLGMTCLIRMVQINHVRMRNNEIGISVDHLRYERLATYTYARHRRAVVVQDEVTSVRARVGGVNSSLKPDLKTRHAGRDRSRVQIIAYLAKQRREGRGRFAIV